MTSSSSLPQDIPFIEKAQLSKYTTFQLGGACRGLWHCRTPEELQSVIRYLHENSLPFILIGGGSNLVVSDQGIDAFVIRYFTDTPFIHQDGHRFTVSGSVWLDEFAFLMAAKGFSGINYCSGIPGTVGGAVVGNAGAFGQQVGDVISSVQLLDPQGNLCSVKPKDLDFSYRSSRLKSSQDIVSSVEFSFEPGDAGELLKEREDILKLRAQKHPDITQNPCAGSFFRNVEPTSKAGKRQAAGWFLEQSGGKELSCGGAQIYEKHANIIVKADGCKSQDVFDLAAKMQGCVKERFNLDLKREVRFVGKFVGKRASDRLIW